MQIVNMQLDKLMPAPGADKCAKKLHADSVADLRKNFHDALLSKVVTPDLLKTFATDDPPGGRNAAQKLVALGHTINLALEDAPLWPMVLALAAFFYLWRLAALLFDLTFVWHYYIRNSKSNESLHRWRKVVKWAEPPATTSGG